MPKRQSGNKKGKQSNFAKLSIFQPNKYKFKKTCPLSNLCWIKWQVMHKYFIWIKKS